MREIKRKSQEVLNLNFSRNSRRRRSQSATQSAVRLPQQEQCLKSRILLYLYSLSKNMCVNYRTSTLPVQSVSSRVQSFRGRVSLHSQLLLIVAPTKTHCV